MQVDEEFKPAVVYSMAQKIKTLASYSMRQNENFGENSYRELQSAYNAMKSMLEYLEIGE